MNLDALTRLEEKSDSSIYNVLQLRLHKSIINLKQQLDSAPSSVKHEIDLTYITSRGKWYDYSWKGQMEKSGGVATNIGIHFFDMLLWLFGGVQRSELHLSEPTKMAGFIELDKAEVTWFLSADRADLPNDVVEKGLPTFRSIEYDGEEIQFSSGFTDLHTRVYEETVAGNGFGIEHARPSIILANELRTSKITENSDAVIHAFAEKYVRRQIQL